MSYNIDRIDMRNNITGEIFNLSPGLSEQEIRETITSESGKLRLSAPITVDSTGLAVGTSIPFEILVGGRETGIIQTLTVSNSPPP